MKSILIYAVVLCVVGRCDFGHAKEVLDVIVDNSGGGLPVANDNLYNFFIKDFFGLINEYTVKINQIKVYLDADYKRWTSQLKSNEQNLELLKNAYSQIGDELSSYVKNILTTYDQVTAIGIGNIIDAINYMRKNEREFYSRVNLNSQKCYNLVDKYLFYKWDEPAIHCANQAILKSTETQLQFTYNINVFYARFVDQFNQFAGVADGEKQNYVTSYLKRAKDELQGYNSAGVKQVQNIGQDTAGCAKKSYDEFESFKKSIDKQAAECF